MKVKEIQENKVVKIGMVNGSGFIFCGRFADADLEALDRENIETLIDHLWSLRTYFLVRMPSEWTRAKFATVDRCAAELKGYVRIAEREIRERYPSAVEKGVEIILIDGNQPGKRALVDETPKPIGHMHTQGVINLVGAIYNDVFESLISEYKTLAKAKKQDDIDRACSYVRAYEKDITDNVYGAYTDPTAIIRKARAVALKDRLTKMLVEARLDEWDAMDRAYV